MDKKKGIIVLLLAAVAILWFGGYLGGGECEDPGTCTDGQTWDTEQCACVDPAPEGGEGAEEGGEGTEEGGESTDA